MQDASLTVATLFRVPDPSLLDEPQPYIMNAMGSAQNSIVANLRICILFSSFMKWYG
jgi:hypothetical protein